MRRYRDGLSRKGRLRHARIQVVNMAYRWRYGRLMSDEEVYHDDWVTWAALIHGGAVVILPLVLGCLGYRWGGKLPMLVGAGVGAWLTWAFYGPLVKLWRAALFLGIFLGMMTVFVYVFHLFWSTL